MKKHTFKSLLLTISLLLSTGISLNAQSVKAKNTVTITSMTPTSGSFVGNTLITLKGTGFNKDSTAGVFLKNAANPNGIGVAVVNYLSDSVITFNSPPRSGAGTYSVYLELLKNAKKINSPSNFDYKLPEIIAITPDSTSTKGNKTIAIAGRYFSNQTNAVVVNFDSAGATIIEVSDTLIKVKNPNSPSAKTTYVSVGVLGQFSAQNDASKFTYTSDKPDSIYTISLENLTGLSKKYKIFVLGYSTNSQKMLTVNSELMGTFTPMPSTPDSGYVESYELGKEITKITVSSTNPIVGARIYFFVADTTVSYKDSSNRTSNHNLGFKYLASGANVNQVMNPPQMDYPQYSYIEATFESNQGLFIDISTVDGFFFPISLLAQNNAGVELDRIGQPNSITAHQIISAYKPFMKNLQLGGEPAEPYNSLFYPVNQDLTALLNPGLYLDGNVSRLETVFDSALNVLFTDSSLNMNIWQNGKGNFNAYYDVVPVKNKTFPGTNNSHSALEFKCDTSKSLYAFNPVGFSVVSYEDASTKMRKAIMGTIQSKVLTFETPLPSNVGLSIGMYVSSGGGSIDGITKISKINMNRAKDKIISVVLDSCSNYSSSFQYKFSKAPTNYYYSSGQMTYAGIGLFADGAYRYADKNDQTVVNGLENQISTALNRGVAVVKFNDTTSKGRTTKNWAIETGWYPKGEPQNYFSYFMHTGKVGDQHIFSLPNGKVKSARGEYMSKAYGFAYDENPNPLGGYDGPQVPSEFSGVFPKGTKKLLLVLGPWKTQE